MIVSKRVSFDAAHFLPGYRGKCYHMHGHHFVVELAVSGEVDEETGMVIDFSELSEFLRMSVVDEFDHRLLNDIIPNPTAENIAYLIKDKFGHQYWSGIFEKVQLEYVKVWETPDSCVELK